jgi:flagellar M-ring protein FliF
VQDLEGGYIKRIDSILAPLVGTGNFRAQVTADVDFDQIEQTAETFKPNPSPDQAIRSQQMSENQTRDGGPQGVPGALSNQPPVPATAPITSPAVPGAPDASGDNPPRSSNRASTTNYELDRTVLHTKMALGSVKRLSVAVVINHRSSTAPNGQTSSAPPSDQELRQITNLVREAVGFDEKRGDTLNIASSAFAEVLREEVPELPMWKDPEVIGIGKEALKYLLVLAAFAFVAFGVIRPLMKQVMPPPGEEEEVEEGEDEEGAEVRLSAAAAEGNTYEAKLARARDLARNDPKVIANLIQEWMGGNEDAKK